MAGNRLPLLTYPRSMNYSTCCVEIRLVNSSGIAEAKLIERNCPNCLELVDNSNRIANDGTSSLSTVDRIVLIPLDVRQRHVRTIEHRETAVFARLACHDSHRLFRVQLHVKRPMSSQDTTLIVAYPRIGHAC